MYFFFQRVFVNKYREEIKKFGMFKRYEDSQAFLLENKHLVCEETANYLVVWCIDLEIEEVSYLSTEYCMNFV